MLTEKGSPLVLGFEGGTSSLHGLVMLLLFSYLQEAFPLASSKASFVPQFRQYLQEYLRCRGLMEILPQYVSYKK